MILIVDIIVTSRLIVAALILILILKFKKASNGIKYSKANDKQLQDKR